MTLMTREQHIRREKATSNICTNEGLSTIACAVYLSQLGKHGVEKLASTLASNAKYLATKINDLEKFNVQFFDSYHFNEFVISSEIDFKSLHETLLNEGIHCGLQLKEQFKELGNAMILSVNEFHTKNDFEILINALKRYE